MRKTIAVLLVLMISASVFGMLAENMGGKADGVYCKDINGVPVADFIVYQGIDVANGDEINITLRVSGEKYRFVNLSVYADSTKVGFISIERKPGAPETGYTWVMVDSSKIYTIIINYTADKKGGNPVWLDIDYMGIVYDEHMVFHEDSTEEFNLTMILDAMIRSARIVRFDASGSYDPDGDVVNYTFDFGDGCLGYEKVVIHIYDDYGTYTVSLTVMDGSGDTGVVSKDVGVVDSAGDYAAYMGMLGVELDCPADLLITDSYNRIIGYNVVNMSFENWIPNSSMILFGDVEIYFIPKEGDYGYRVSGNDDGKYVFSVFSPGEYSPGEYGPGEYAGKTYSVDSTVTGSMMDDLYVANGSVSISSNTDKYYSLYIKHEGESFSLEDVHITSDITHNYTVTDWSLLSSTDTPSVKLEMYNGSILEAVQELCSGLFGYSLLRPDLTIIDVTTTDSFSEGEIVSFSVEILNKAIVTPASLAVARDVCVRLYVDDEYVGSSSTISLIYANHTAYASVQWKVKSGNHTLRFVVCAEDDINLDNNEHIMNVEVSANQPPTPVVLNTPTEITANSMPLSWSQNMDDDFVNYTIYQSTAEGVLGNPIYVITDNVTTSYNVTGLSPSMTYYFIVRVYDTGGLCNDSNQVSGTTLSVNPPPNLVTLNTPTEINEDSMKLTWSESSDADFAKYEIYQSTLSGIIGVLIYTENTKNVTSYTVTGLSSGTTYYFIVRVYDTDGLYNDSNQVSGKTLAEVTTGNLTGTVTDKNGKPIGDVTVTIVATDYVTLTDSNGEYDFTGVPASAYGVTAEKNGYETKTVTGVNINAGETTTLNIVLEKEKKPEEKGFIPGFELLSFLIILVGCTTLLRYRKRFQ